MWIPPVYDRTELDVLNRTPKGACNASDRNRMEGNSEVLAELLGVDIETRQWTRLDFPTGSQMRRMRDNIAALRNAYFVYTTTPPTPEHPMNTWQKWNDAEKILHDLHEIYFKNQTLVYYAGEIYASEAIGVL